MAFYCRYWLQKFSFGFQRCRARRQMSHMGQERRFDDVGAMSAITPIATDEWTFGDGRKAPWRHRVEFEVSQ
jgi:hypothetical protein